MPAATPAADLVFNPSLGWIAVDLDGTLAVYDGWKGVAHIGRPVPPMLNRIKAWIAEGQEVRIFTARVCEPRMGGDGDASADVARQHIAAWLVEHGIGGLAITNQKDFGMVAQYDDRAFHVIPNTGIVVEPGLRHPLDTETEVFGDLSKSLIGQPAVFDGPDHRLWLSRQLPNAHRRPLVVVGHNPSVAAEEKSDQTLRKVIGFGHRLECGEVVLVNMATRVATKAADIQDGDQLNSLHADDALETAFAYARDNDGIVLFCPGAPKGRVSIRRQLEDRYDEVYALAARMDVQLRTLRLSPKGWPEHPLYLGYDLAPIEFERKAA